MSSDKKCCVPGCFEAGGASHPVRLHVFPNPTKEPQRFKAWRLSVGGHILELTNEHIYKYRRVCHAHFEEKFHCRYNRLSNIAIPTLNLADEHKRNIEREENIPEVQSALSGVSEVSRPRKRSFTSIQNIGVCLPSTSKEMEEVEQLEADIAELRKLLQCKEGELFDMKQKLLSGPPIHGENGYNTQTVHTNYTPRTQMSNVPKWAIERYSRQILLPDIGVQGQEKLMASKVLVVGAGGLGCPAAVYLAGAGVGEIGIVDYDCVDITNIHRQILHEEKDENTCKADSAADSLRRLNTKIKVTPYNLQLDSKNALQIISHYDLVLDCTDNVPTRFLLNDACVMTKKPLISGSALKMEGQLTLYGYRSENNYNEKDTTFVGPCYRCVFPSPPPPEAVGSCSANGVAGPVPGIIGAMQALEAIKLIVGQTHDALLVGRMLLFDGEDMTFRNVKLRPRNPECVVCSSTPTITSLIDYEVFCKAQAKEKDLDLQVLTPEYRKSATELADEMTQMNVTEKRHLLVDVRSAPEFNMCNIEGAVNYPIEKLYDATLNKLVEDIKESNQVTFICRRGNDSQLAVQKVLELVEEPYRSRIKDLTGGLHAWSKYVNPEFPVY